MNNNDRMTELTDQLASLKRALDSVCDTINGLQRDLNEMATDNPTGLRQLLITKELAESLAMQIPRTLSAIG